MSAARPGYIWHACTCQEINVSGGVASRVFLNNHFARKGSNFALPANPNVAMTGAAGLKICMRGFDINGHPELANARECFRLTALCHSTVPAAIARSCFLIASFYF